MKTEIAPPRSFADPHFNVSLVLSAPGLSLGQFEIVGYYYPAGFLGESIPQYRYKVESRARHDDAARSALRRHGNTAQGANALFESLRPF